MAQSQPTADSLHTKVHLKTVIIGESAVGKTTFVHRYKEKQFKETISTLGASFGLKQWRSYNIALWDTAGEERFRGLSNFYCRGAGAAILAFDLTDEDSFHSLRAVFIPLLESALPDCIKIVVGTKLDLIPTLGRAVSIEDGETLANEINRTVTTSRTLYFETSSVTGANVEEAFNALFEECLPAMKLRNEGSENTISLGGDANASQGYCRC